MTNPKANPMTDRTVGEARPAIGSIWKDRIISWRWVKVYEVAGGYVYAASCREDGSPSPHQTRPKGTQLRRWHKAFRRAPVFPLPKEGE